MAKSKSLEVIRETELEFIPNVKTLRNNADKLIVKNQADEKTAVDIVKPIKDLYKKIDEKRKNLTAGAKEYINAVNDMFNPHLKDLKDIEAIIKGKLSKYRQAFENRLSAKGKEPEKTKESKKGNTVTYMVKIGFKITDKGKIPFDYYCIDTRKIEDDIKRGLSIPGIEKTDEKIPCIG